MDRRESLEYFEGQEESMKCGVRIRLCYLRAYIRCYIILPYLCTCTMSRVLLLLCCRILVGYLSRSEIHRGNVSRGSRDGIMRCELEGYATISGVCGGSDRDGDCARSGWRDAKTCLLRAGALHERCRRHYITRRHPGTLRISWVRQ